MKRILTGLFLTLALAVSDCEPSFAQSNSYAKQIGVIKWTKATVTLDGSSDTALAAKADRAGLLLLNPLGNDTVYIDIAGGTAASTTAVPIPGGTYFVVTGSATPGNAVTVIGTNTQLIYVWEGL